MKIRYNLTFFIFVSKKAVSWVVKLRIFQTKESIVNNIKQEFNNIKSLIA